MNPEAAKGIEAKAVAGPEGSARARGRESGAPFRRRIANIAVAVAVASFAWLAAPARAWADEGGAGSGADDHRGSLTVGAFYAEPTTSASLDRSGGSGTNINLERNLGLPKHTTVARLSGDYWLSDRARLDFSLFQYRRSATRQVDKTIEFGDSVFPINTVVMTSSKVTIFKAAYTFAPIRRSRGFFGLTGGLYFASSALSLNDTTVGADESDNVDAPLPVIGVRGEYDLTRRVMLIGAVEWFGIATNKAGGRLVDSYIGVDYSFSERVALGLAYNNVTMSLHAKNDRGLEGRLNWGYNGGLLYLKLNFG